MSTPAPLPRLPFSRPCITEAAALEVADVVRSGWITSGPKVAQFEREFAAAVGSPHAVALCSATAGLDVVFQAMDLQPGDEVITPSINWVSGPNMVELNGGRTVFCEVHPRSLNLDLADVVGRITPRTRAIMPVHFCGAPVDLAGVRRLAAERGLVVVEDAAHAAGARHQGAPIGQVAGERDVAVFSFHPTKNLTTAEGGMITCRSEELAARLRLLRFHGIRKDAWKNHARSGKDLYRVERPGRKYNLTDIQAVLGIHQLRDLERMNAERAALAAGYYERLAGCPILECLDDARPGDTHSWHIFVVLLRLERLRINRAALVDILEGQGIGTALHFPAVHPQEHYARTYPGTSLPVSEALSERLLTIPLFPGMTPADLDRVAAAFTQIAQEHGR